MSDYNYGPNANIHMKIKDTLNWMPLQKRRAVSDASMLHKITTNRTMEMPSYILPRGQNQFVQIQARTDVFKNSFYPRTVRLWNQLPGAIKAIPGPDPFKSQFQKWLQGKNFYLAPATHTWAIV